MCWRRPFNSWKLDDGLPNGWNWLNLTITLWKLNATFLLLDTIWCVLRAACFGLTDTRELHVSRSVIENCNAHRAFEEPQPNYRKRWPCNFPFVTRGHFRHANCLCIYAPLVTTHRADVHYMEYVLICGSRQWKWLLFIVDQNNLKCDKEKKKSWISSFANYTEGEIRLLRSLQEMVANDNFCAEIEFKYIFLLKVFLFYKRRNIYIQNVVNWRL